MTAESTMRIILAAVLVLAVAYVNSVIRQLVQCDCTAVSLLIMLFIAFEFRPHSSGQGKLAGK